MDNATVAAATKPRAYSYVRFSTPEQQAGDSYRRQAAMAQDYAIRHGLELDERSFEDLGVSAYRGKNAATGMLAEFIDAVRQGMIPRGSHLLIENLDRLSRMKPRKAVRLLEQIVEEDITVVTLTDGKVYDEATLDDDPMAFMWAFMVAIRANQESALKSERIKKAWMNKRRRAGEIKLTAKAPTWLKLSDDRKSFEVIDERAAVVRRIFDMARRGIGQHKIAQSLNRESIKPLGRGKMWRRSNVTKLLDYEGVIGTFTPHTIEVDESNRKVRKPEEKIQGYYPAIVPMDAWSDVQALKSGGTRNPQRGRHQTITNVLGGFAICAGCGETMIKVNKGKGWEYLVCSRAKVGAGCEYRTSVYRDIEDAVFDRLPQYLDEIPAGDIAENVDRVIENTEAEIDELWDVVTNLADELASRRSPAISERLRKAEADLETAKETLAGLRKRREALSSVYIRQRVHTLQAAIGEKSSAEKINACLRMVFDRAVIDRSSGLIEFIWKQGGPSAFVPFAAPKQFRSKEGKAFAEHR
jgi:DNA invertase Pin-like site-specific DNA recombinase